MDPTIDALNPITLNENQRASASKKTFERLLRLSRNILLFQDVNISGGHSPSPSSMISFELANGHPCGPHVLTSLDDDHYVEYQLNDLVGFPSNAEEEKRMLMETVMEWLKDLEMRCPGADQPSTVSSRPVNPLEKDHQDNVSTENSTPSVAESSSRVEDIMPSSTDAEFILTGAEKSQPMSLTNAQNLAYELNQTSRGVATDTCPAVMDSGCRSSVSENSSRLHSSSDADVSDTTKATLTVEKNPPANIMDGFIRRFDLNFFRNSQNSVFPFVF